MKRDNFSNRVFIGCPFKNVRDKYVVLIELFKKKYPLSFVIIGRSNDQNAEGLLEIIKDKLFSSSFAVFDASNGNANVSLEYGLAEAMEIPRAIYITKHKRAQRDKSDSAIISDLAGKVRHEYKQRDGLKKLLEKLAQTHSYTKRFEIFMRRSCKSMSKGQKKSTRALALKIIHCLDEKDSVRRSDIVQELNGQGYKNKEVNSIIKKLHANDLIRCEEGRYSSVTLG